MTSTARTLLIHAGQALVSWRERPALALAWAGGVAVALLLLVLGVVTVTSGGGDATSPSAGTGLGEAADTDTWRYLLVCRACGYRTRTDTHPARLYESSTGRLQCPACRQFAANWFRRGSLAVPPGGWDVTPQSSANSATGTPADGAADPPAGAATPPPAPGATATSRAPAEAAP